MKNHPTQTPEQWQSHIESWAASGKSQSDYCKERDLPVSVFGYWKRKLSGITTSGSSTGASSTPFIPVAIIEEPPLARATKGTICPAISVHVGTAYRIDLLPGFDPATLRQALSVLRD